MAKSLRSKWRRKMKAIKRERYGKKELEKLKCIIDGAKKGSSTGNIEMTDLQELVTVVSAPGRSDQVEEKEEDQMEVDRIAKIYDPQTLKDQFGNFPIWMSTHRKKKILKKQKKLNKIKKKKLKNNIRK